MLTLLIIFGCSNSIRLDNKENVRDSCSTAKSDLPKEKLIAKSNELIVNENCVIFMWPDSTELAEMQAKYDEETYLEIAADISWYPGIASEVLDSFNIKYQNCDKEYLILVSSKNDQIKLKRKELDGDMVLFHVDKEPIISSAIDFDREQMIEYYKLLVMR